MTQYTVQAQITRVLGDDLSTTRQLPTFVVDSAYQGGQTVGDMMRVVLEILATDQLPPGSSWSVTMQNLTTKKISTMTSDGVS
jgi:hypothetical protein